MKTSAGTFINKHFWFKNIITKICSLENSRQISKKRKKKTLKNILKKAADDFGMLIKQKIKLNNRKQRKCKFHWEIV